MIRNLWLLTLCMGLTACSSVNSVAPFDDAQAAQLANKMVPTKAPQKSAHYK